MDSASESTERREEKKNGHELTFHVNRRLNGSIPLVGSSKNITLESPQKAMATESFRFIPPKDKNSKQCEKQGEHEPALYR